MTPPRTRSIPATDQYPGLFAIEVAPGREIVAIGEGAEEAVMAEVARREQEGAKT